MVKFWKLKEMFDIKDLSNEKRVCEAHFKIFTVRDEDGRYCVRLPFIKM